VWELADSARNRRDLYRRAMRIGRDHIASSVYTIAFATAGAALSTLLLLSIYQMPLGDVLRSETFAGEIVRTLVGSIGLVLAVPLTTAIGTMLAWATLHGGGGQGRSGRVPDADRRSAGLAGARGGGPRRGIVDETTPMGPGGRAEPVDRAVRPPSHADDGRRGEDPGNPPGPVDDSYYRRPE
jgi:hypothetical protein